MKNIIIFLLVLLLITCTLPPYDEDLSESLNTIENMTKEAEILKIENLYEIENNSYFLPCKSDYSKGFIVTEMADRIDLQYIEDEQRITGGEYAIRSRGTHSNNYYVNIIKGPDPFYGDYITFNRMYYYNTANFDLYYLNYEPTLKTIQEDRYGPFETCNQFLLPPSYPPQYLIGSYIGETPLSTFIAFIIKYSSFNTYYEELWELDNIGQISNPFVINLDFRGQTAGLSFPELPGDLENVFYFFDYNTLTSFISFYDDIAGQYLSYKIDNTGVLYELNLPYKIDAVVSTGLIYCEKNGKAYIYDYNGNQQYIIGLGDLKFNYEVWDKNKSKYKMIFTLPFTTNSHHDDYQNYYIYSIPTEDLSLLR